MDVILPQLGETVIEATITSWLVAVGDLVALDEPLYEVSTDKVDSEVPSPGAGILVEILVEEGETIGVGTRLAVIADAAPAASIDQTLDTVSLPGDIPIVQSREQAGPSISPHDDRVTSPVVRRLIVEHGLDVTTITGTGEAGRITRRDVLDVVHRTGPAVEESRGSTALSDDDDRIPFDNIRRRTAEHMVRSKATSAHVYTSIEVDYERIEHLRSAHQAAWKAAEGFSLTYLPFIVRAFCEAAREFPRVNASIEGESIVVHAELNVGLAVDLDFKGLVVPVVRNPAGRGLRSLAREIRDLATRARSKRLEPDEVLGGTFTITNMGPFGTLMTLPIINQPQVAILATDSIRKKPVALEGPDGDDLIAVHPIGVLALTWDHRAFDGAYAATFLRTMRDILETRDWESELK